MTDQTPISHNTRTAPLSALFLHTINPRQTHDEADIAALAKSIAINGLLQNLNVYDGPEGLGVVAGGRRLRALELLAREGTDIENGVQIDFDNIPIHATSDEMMARSWAGTEGATQRPLHPAEEIRAYAAMADQGNTADLIAAAFGQTRAHVMRRLRLSRLSEETLTALRDGQITLDVAQVLTLTDSLPREMEALTLATDHEYNADRLRRQLLEGNVASNDRRVRYIGLDLYRAEGGKMDEDLFSDQSVLHNVELVDRLFKEKLTKAAEDLQEAEGFMRVTPVFETWLGYQHTEGMQRIFAKSVDLPEADEERYNDLCEIGNVEEFSEEEAAEFAVLEARMTGDYDDTERAAATAFILVDHKGELEHSGVYIPAKNSARSASSETGGPAPVKPAINQSGLDDLHRIQRIALQTEMLRRPDLVLDLLAFQLWHEMPSWSGPFNMRTDEQTGLPSDTGETNIDKRITGEDDEPLGPLGADIAADFTAFLDKGKKHRNTVLTQALVRCMNAPFGARINAALLQSLEISPRSIWTPTAENFFKACRSETLNGIWRELVVTEDRSDQMDRFAKLKVSEKRKELEELFNDTGTQEALGLSRTEIAAIDAWLPDAIRGEVQ
jgi:ParB family chromosome partitioning protein